MQLKKGKLLIVRGGFVSVKVPSNSEGNFLNARCQLLLPDILSIPRSLSIQCRKFDNLRFFGRKSCESKVVRYDWNIDGFLKMKFM